MLARVKTTCGMAVCLSMPQKDGQAFRPGPQHHRRSVFVGCSVRRCTLVDTGALHTSPTVLICFSMEFDVRQLDKRSCLPAEIQRRREHLSTVATHVVLVFSQPIEMLIYTGCRKKLATIPVEKAPVYTCPYRRQMLTKRYVDHCNCDSLTRGGSSTATLGSAEVRGLRRRPVTAKILSVMCTKSSF